ncbi:helix-turn-helix domain-containing protein [Nonomuraea roseoviolacea]|uniref:Transcriptional regulator with XRE-family HTH domain n=1 Tax=Nonomuraea roseoviolacea subsp. carminata TaxID=160689 RepID=A0ABT1JUJ4_9ACTN|nr:helix-turn-helix transcriptional regulator [Nonomuraea roseoviolacea]MCP2345421.1 transcriptional regulator with XRE-family HTH domain [Nonomuraea roseoviolacea subsp. carminata]
MDIRTLPDALKAIMAQRGWTQADLAQQLGVSQAWVSQVSSGVRDTRMGRAIELLGRVGWEVRMSPATEEPVERREFLTAAALVFVPSASKNPYQNPHYVDKLAESLARNRYECGGIPLAARALNHVTHVGAVPDISRRRLQRAVSELLYQVTLVLYDAAKLVHAERTGMLALELARKAADAKAEARAIESLSRVALYRGDTARAIMYARRGLAVPELPASRVASLTMRLGRSLARVPEHGDAARETLERALQVDGLSRFAQAATVGDVAIGLNRLGRYEEAGALLRRAADEIGEYSPLFRAQYIGRQVQTAIGAADPGLAADRMTLLTRAVPFVSSARVNQRVQEIMRGTAQWRNVPEVREAREHLGAVSSYETPKV